MSEHFSQNKIQAKTRKSGVKQTSAVNLKKTSKKTLWVVTELYYPEETSTGYYLTRIAEGLTDKFDVKVLCGQPNYSARGVRAKSREVHRDVEIFRSFGTTLDKNVIFFRLINMLTLSLSIFWNALRRFKKSDRVLVVTTPPSLPFISAVACLLRGAVYTLLIHDNYPEILIAAGKSAENSPVVKLLNRFNRWLYKYAVKIIVVGRDMKKMIERKIAGLDVPVVVIPNWAELETVEPTDRNDNRLLRELNLSDKFVFLYAGNMGYPNDLESIVQCAAELERRLPVHFIFLGAGVKRGKLIKTVEEKKLTNVTILPPQPRSEQIVFLNACDVALVSLVKKMWGVSMPSRTYNILAAGKPILALTENDSELARVVEEEKIGWIASPDQPEILLRIIEKIYNEKKEISEMNLRSRRSAIEKYSLNTAIESYRQIID